MLTSTKLRVILIAGMTLAALISGSVPPTLHAQSIWPPATVLWQAEQGEEPYTNNATHLVTDPFGSVHLAWLNFPSAAGNNSDQVVIYYSRWDSQGWTAPVDIFASTAMQPLGGPVLLPTDDGRLHILWISGSNLLHSSAWAGDAARPQAWEKPVATTSFLRPVFAGLDAAVDAKGRFHVIFSERPGDAYYIRSNDQGATWSEPTVVSNVSSVGPDITAYKPKTTVAPDGRIHVVWTEADISDDTGTGRVKYAFSTDDGATWSETRDFGGPAHGDPNVTAFTEGDVYVAWNGGVASEGGRFFKYSRDGGATWTDRIQFSQRRGLSNYPSIAQDSLGRLHILTGDGEYVIWDGITVTPAVPLSPVEIQTERCRLTISSGNTLVAIFPPDDGVVYTAVRVLEAPTIPALTPPARAVATTQPTATGAPTIAVSVLAATPGVAAANFSTAAPTAARSGTFAIILSTSSALAVVLAVVAWRLRARRR